MQNRLRLLMGASALLYVGPLLAGLSGMGWAAVPVFMALFALWLVVMRPAQWPRNLALWSSETAVAAAAQLAVNALIVIVLFGIGRGIGGVAGFLPNIPPFLPVAISFLAVPLSRWAVNPVQATELDQMLDSALRQIDDPSAPGPAAPKEDEMVAVLLSLPADSDPMLTADAVEAAMRGARANTRLSQLEAALDPLLPDRRALREAVILWSTDLARHEGEGLLRAQRVAFAVAGSDPVLLHLFAYRGAALLGQTPGLWPGFPDASEVSMAVDSTQPDNLQAGLNDLARALEAAVRKDLPA